MYHIRRDRIVKQLNTMYSEYEKMNYIRRERIVKQSNSMNSKYMKTKKYILCII